MQHRSRTNHTRCEEPVWLLQFGGRSQLGGAGGIRTSVHWPAALSLKAFPEAHAPAPSTESQEIGPTGCGRHPRAPFPALIFGHPIFDLLWLATGDWPCGGGGGARRGGRGGGGRRRGGGAGAAAGPETA